MVFFERVLFKNVKRKFIRRNNKILRENVNFEPISFNTWYSRIRSQYLQWVLMVLIGDQMRNRNVNNLLGSLRPASTCLGQSRRETQHGGVWFPLSLLLRDCFHCIRTTRTTNIANVKSSWFNYLEERQFSGLVFIFILHCKKINNFRISIVDCGQF